MSLWDIGLIARDVDLRPRIAAAAAANPKAPASPVRWADERAWVLAASPGWASAYRLALDSGVTNPGRRADVITDAMITAAVGARL